MELIALQGEREEHLRVESRGPGRFAVRVGEREYEVDSAETGTGVHSLLIEGRQFEVTVAALGSGEYRITNGASNAVVSVTDPLTYKARLEGGALGVAGRRTISAYMPGRVVEVLVADGEKVVAGSGLVILEAMKMENEIQAETDCVVHHVLVQPNQAVEAGDPLFEIE